jgi:hypothetical protein
VAADGLEASLLALLVLSQGLEILANLGQLEPGVVQSLLRLLSLFVESVDLDLDIVDVGVGERGGCGDQRNENDRSCGGQCERGSLPAVKHERTISSLSTPTG